MLERPRFTKSKTAQVKESSGMKIYYLVVRDNQEESNLDFEKISPRFDDSLELLAVYEDPKDCEKTDNVAFSEVPRKTL